jgi:hypothetical protein
MINFLSCCNAANPAATINCVVTCAPLGGHLAALSRGQHLFDVQLPELYELSFELRGLQEPSQGVSATYNILTLLDSSGGVLFGLSVAAEGVLSLNNLGNDIANLAGPSLLPECANEWCYVVIRYTGDTLAVSTQKDTNAVYYITTLNGDSLGSAGTAKLLVSDDAKPSAQGYIRNILVTSKIFVDPNVLSM